jgi:shikimate kinase
LSLSASVFLVGLPGSGKSTVGRQLARRLGLPFVDVDALAESRLGCSVRAFFEREGEAAFRALETALIDEVSHRPVSVVSTGGGAVLRDENRQAMRRRGHVVYLRSSPDELYRRLRHDRNRPLLQVDDPLAKLRELHALRHPLYEQTAHFVIDTGRPSVATLVNMIVMQLELAGLMTTPAPDPEAGTP